MASAEELVNSYCTPKYGCPFYCILKWNVFNVSTVTNVLTSPCFDFSQTSKWILSLDPVARIADGVVGIYLRNRSYSNPKGCRLKGEITVYRPNKNEVFNTEFDEQISSELINDLKFYVDRNVFSESVPHQDDCDSCLIRCDIIVSPAIEINTLSHSVKLSSDFQKLLDYSKNSDVTIYANDGSIRAHKFILSARSTVLEDMLSSFSNWVPCESECALIHSTLPFIYCGDPQYLITKHPFKKIGDIINVAKKLKLKELEKIFTPMKIQWNSRIPVREFIYDVKIYNFSKLEGDYNGCIQSYDFVTNEEIGTKWKLLIKRYACGITSRIQYGIYLDKISLTNSDHDVEMEFCMSNPKTGECITETVRDVFKGSTQHGFPSFVDKQTLYSKFLSDDTLSITCKLKLHDAVVSWVNCYFTNLDYSDNSRSFKDLCRDMKDLYESKKHVDIVLFAGNEQLVAHKAVLWARSPYFIDEVSFSSNQYRVKSVDADTMKDILPYIYSAELPQLNRINAAKIYEASVLFKLHDLRKVCQAFIQVNIDVENVLEILKMAHRHTDYILISAAETFATEIAATLLNTSRWRLFCANHNQLAMRLYDKMVRSLII